MQTPPDAERRFKSGLTILEVLLICGVLVLLTFWLGGTMVARRYARSSRIGCANNLKQTGLAFKTWALDNGDKFPMEVAPGAGGTMGMTNAGQLFAHFMVMSNELSTPRILACPEDRGRKAAANFAAGFSDQNVSYFLNLDAADSRTNMILSGDANLTNAQSAKTVLLGTNQSFGWSKTVHRHSGHILFLDGSVNKFNNGGVPAAVLRESAVAGDRLLMP